jgi:hypothetical protein
MTEQEQVAIDNSCAVANAMMRRSIAVVKQHFAGESEPMKQALITAHMQAQATVYTVAIDRASEPD